MVQTQLSIECDEKHRYTVNGERFPSVTQILGVLDKGGLVWWGQGVGVKGVCELARAGEELDWRDPDGIVKLLTHYKMTVNHVKNKAGTRGSSLHRAQEAWWSEQKVLNAADFPAEDRGYVQALARFFVEERPKIVSMERAVASVTYEYAGRYDFVADMPNGEIVRWDMKTSRNVYPEQVFPQLAAYEFAAVEMGERPTDKQMVLRLDADGTFQTAVSTATFADFLGIKCAYDAVQRLKREYKQHVKDAA